MNNVKNNIRKEFTIIPNYLINDNSLSDRARFIFVYMASKPDDWTFYNSELSKSLKYSIATLRKYIEELSKSGWISKRSQSRINGMFTANTYILNSTPKSSPCYNFPDTVKNGNGRIPTPKKIVSEKNRVGKTLPLNNKELHKKERQIKNTSKKKIKILK